MLTLINALVFFRTDRQPPPWRLMHRALLTSLATVLLGVVLLGWVNDNAAAWLETALGVAIVLCAVSLVIRRQQASSVGAPRAFSVAGALSGLMGGLFGTSGPPIVFYHYRQPLATDVVRRALLVMFASKACTRLVLVPVSMGISAHALLLCVLSFPVVHVTTRLTTKRPPPWSPAVMRPLVAALLALSGIAMITR